VHCVVTGGGLASDVQGRLQPPRRWLSCRPGFFLPVRVVGVAATLAGAATDPAAVPERCPSCGGTVWQVVARLPRPRVAEICRLPLGVDSS
jgi:hypothetical protein